LTLKLIGFGFALAFAVPGAALSPQARVRNCGADDAEQTGVAAGGQAFQASGTDAFDFKGAALSPTCGGQAAGEGAGLDATRSTTTATFTRRSF